MSDYQSPSGVPQPGPGYQPPGAYPPPPASGYPPAPGGYPGQQPAYPPAPPQYPTPPAYPASAPPAYPASAPPGYPASAPPGYPASAPPGYPPSGYPPLPVPGPPPKKSRVGLIIGIAAAVVVLCAALGGVGIYLFARSVKGPADTVNAWLNAAQDANLSKVQSLTCEKYKNTIDETDLIDETLTSATWTVTNVNITNDTATVTISVHYTEGGTAKSDTVTYNMVKEGGDWKVCGVA